MDLNRFARSYKAMLSAKVVHVLATGALTLVLARFLLSPKEYGLLGGALAVIGVAQLFADLGIAGSGARYITEYRESRPSQVPHVIRIALGYRLAAIGVVGGIFVLFSGSVAGLVGQPELGPLLALGAGYLAVYSLFAFSKKVFQGFNQVTYTAVVATVGSVARLGLAVAFVVLLGGAVGALAGYVVGYGVGAAVGLVLVYVECYRGTDRASESEAGLAGKIARYSVPLTATRGANVLDKRVDVILVGYFIGPVAVSFYYLSKQIVDLVQTPAASLGFTLSPSFGEFKAAGETDQAARVYETTLKYVLLLYVPAAAGMIMVAEPTIRLVFGAKYAPAAPVLQVFSGYVVLQTVTFVTSDALDYLGRARSRAYAKGTAAAANFLLNLLFIPAFGVPGAAAATVITHTGYATANVAIIHQELSLSVGWIVRHLAATLSVAAVMAVAVWLVLSTGSGPGVVVVAVLFGVTVWVALSILLGLLDLRRVVTVLS